MNPAFALAEVVWILSGNQDSAFMNFWNPGLPDFAGDTSAYPGAYGFRYRQHFGIDQLERAARALEANPETRQVVLQIWDPTVDLPREDGRPSHADVPCNVTSLVKVREDRLEWLQVVRSNDLFLGVPHNFVQFTSIQEVLAGWIGVQVGSYTQVSDSLHVYERDAARVRDSGGGYLPPSTFSLAYPREVSQRSLQDLEIAARLMIQPDLNPRSLNEIVGTFEGPESFVNWVRLLGAESARRRGWENLIDELGHSLTDPVLATLWDRWQVRVADRSNLKNESAAVPNPP